MSLRRIRIQSLAIVLLAIVALLPVRSFASEAGSQKNVEPRVPQVVADGTARLLSHADANRQYELAIALPVHNQAALDKLRGDLYSKNSGIYHQWLSVDQFADRFGYTKADYAKVVNYLKEQGFSIEYQHANRLDVSFTGTTAQIERAFHVRMNIYQHPYEDRTFYAPDREPTFSGLSIPVQLIAGLDNYVLPHSHLKKNPLAPKKAAAAIKPNAISRAASLDCYGAPYSVNVGTGGCNTYTPNDLRTAYYGGTALTGAGQQIGILGFGGASAEDLAAQAQYDNATVPTVTYIIGSACAKSSCENNDGEQVLDVMFSSGFAPGAGINFFSNSNNDLTIIAAMASSKVSSVYTSSWGWGFGNHVAEDTDFQEMQTQGQTFLNATGDDGGYNSSTWDYPSGDPYITEVGGTQLITTTNGGSWSGEKGWPYSGGGTPPAADSYATPTWQAGVGNGTNGVSTTKRSDPDIASEADYEMLGCEATVCEDTYGGTSYAAPTWAGYFALLNQYSVAAGNGTLGFANYELYEAGENSMYSANYHDVTACGGIDAGEETGPNCSSSDTGTPVQGYNPVAGYDGVTGWGSPNGQGLISALTVPTLSITAGPYTSASSIGFTLDFPEMAGTVTITAAQGGGSAVSIATCALASGTCTATATGASIGFGTFSIVGVYEQTTTSTKKYTVAQNITIAADNTSTSASASPGSIPSTGSTSVSATVTDITDSSVTPTGSVTFTLGSTSGTLLGICTLSSGTCSTTVQGSALGTGANTIYANYQGVTNDYNTSDGSTSVTVTVTSSNVITFSSVSHNFGQVQVGTAAAAYGIVVKNTSTTTAYPFSLVFTASKGFTVATNCPAIIAAGKSCNLQFNFTPTASGAVSTTWSLASEGGFTYSPSNGGTLSGSGTSQGGVSVTTSGHNFGTVTVGMKSPTYGVELSNSTTSAVTLTKGMVSSPFASVTNCPATLAAGSSCELEFTFTPTTTSTVQQVYALSGSVTITAQGQPLPNGGITLTGN